MRFTPTLLLCALFAGSSTVRAAAPSDYAGSSATFTLDHHAKVPGDTLKPGDYTIRIVDQLSDRMIIRVDSTSTKEHAIFLGVLRSGLAQASASGPGPITWASQVEGQPALRGFSFASGAKVEFVYPKLQAVQLAKRNDAKVVAIDPESQELPNLKKMSKDDLTIVYLWTLSLTTVGNERKPNAVLAQRFQPTEHSAPVVAENATPNSPAPVQVASAEPPVYWQAPSRPRRAALTTLPKTAGNTSLLALAGLLSLITAGLLAMFKRTQAA